MVRGILSLSVLACASPEPLSLIEPTGWTLDDAASDPWPEHRPSATPCLPSSWYEESGGLEVATDDCPYFSGFQALPMDLDEGDALRVVAWHQALGAVPEAVGHWAVLIDGVVVWELSTAIPAPAKAFDDIVMSPVAAAAGAPITVHLHNHGANTWNLFDVLLETP